MLPDLCHGIFQGRDRSVANTVDISLGLVNFLDLFGFLGEDAESLNQSLIFSLEPRSKAMAIS
ncbi:hypothetical protein VPNG_00621 [Cytospora leucostoma]|uniref:Uncharacterized protein n=1 Tax=Cytospora leucostoma TaxID=1230097 RepID=A0A423XME9_9PEZI|nr:hypothetical protein VPNG_00621 [Cytospora leucostoma]